MRLATDALVEFPGAAANAIPDGGGHAVAHGDYLGVSGGGVGVTARAVDDGFPRLPRFPWIWGHELSPLYRVGCRVETGVSWLARDPGGPVGTGHAGVSSAALHIGSSLFYQRRPCYVHVVGVWCWHL